MKLRQDGIYLTEADGEMVVLDTDAATYLKVNTVGALILSRLQGGATASELVSAVVDRFTVEHALAEADVELFVAELRKHRLLND